MPRKITRLNRRRRSRPSLNRAFERTPVEAKLHKTVDFWDMAPVGMAVVDRNLVVRRVNKAFHAFSGGPLPESGGCRVEDVNRFFGPTLKPLLKKVLKNGRKILNVELNGRRNLYSDRPDRWFMSCFPVRQAAKKPTEIFVVMQDMTERKKMEARVTECEGRFSRVADTAPVMIWQADADKHCTFCNKTWLEFTGRPLKDQLGEGWLESVHSDDRQKCFEEFAQTFDARQPFLAEYRLRRHDGEYRWVLDNGRAIWDLHGQFAGYVGSCIDITERKQMEDALQRTEELSHAVLESMRPTAILDRSGILLKSNKMWQLLDAGGQNSPLVRGAVGDNYFDVCQNLIAEGEECGSRVLEGLRAVLDKSRKDFATEYLFDSPAGPRWYYLDIAPLIHTAGGVILSHHEITGQKQDRLEAEKNRLDLAHVQRVSAIGELAASFAHELNQPLTAILSNAQTARRLLETEPSASTDIREILEEIVSDDKRAADVIQRLRALIKKKPSDYGPIRMNNLVAGVAELLRNDALIRGVNIELQVTPDLPLVTGDDVQLQQVLVNLVLNGLEAMAAVPPERRTLTLRTGLADSKTLRVSVKDGGHGIAKGRLDRVFEPYYTTKKEGLGMGLSISKSIIESHNGRLKVDNNLDHGATFHFTLPVHRG